MPLLLAASTRAFETALLCWAERSSLALTIRQKRQ
jgi:hypothetical protein